MVDQSVVFQNQPEIAIKFISQTSNESPTSPLLAPNSPSFDSDPKQIGSGDTHQSQAYSFQNESISFDENSSTHEMKDVLESLTHLQPSPSSRIRIPQPSGLRHAGTTGVKNMDEDKKDMRRDFSEPVRSTSFASITHGQDVRKHSGEEHGGASIYRSPLSRSKPAISQQRASSLRWSAPSVASLQSVFSGQRHSLANTEKTRKSFVLRHETVSYNEFSYAERIQFWFLLPAYDNKGQRIRLENFDVADFAAIIFTENVLHPKSDFSTVWDLLMIAAHFLILWVIPFIVGFDMNHEVKNNIEIAITIVYRMDSVIGMVTPQSDVTDSTSSFREYESARPSLSMWLRIWAKYQLLFDLISMIPFALFMETEAEKVLSFIRLIRIVRIPAMMQRCAYFRRGKLWIDDTVGVGISKTFPVALTILFFIHINACVMYFVAKSNEFRGWDLVWPGFLELIDYVKWKRLDSATRDKLVSYYETKYRGKYFEEDALLSDMNESLREEIECHNTRELMEKVPFLRQEEMDGRDDTYFYKLATELHALYFIPGDFIMKQGESGNDMYFILSGKVNVFVDGNRVTSVYDASYIGGMSSRGHHLYNQGGRGSTGQSGGSYRNSGGGGGGGGGGGRGPNQNHHYTSNNNNRSTFNSAKNSSNTNYNSNGQFSQRNNLYAPQSSSQADQNRNFPVPQLNSFSFNRAPTISQAVLNNGTQGKVETVRFEMKGASLPPSRKPAFGGSNQPGQRGKSSVPAKPTSESKLSNVASKSPDEDAMAKRAERFETKPQPPQQQPPPKRRELFKPEQGSLDGSKSLGSDPNQMDFISFGDMDPAAAEVDPNKDSLRQRGKYDNGINDRDPLEILYELPQPVWVEDSRKYSKNLREMFSQEVEDYVAYISPTAAEHSVRHLTIERLRHVVSRLWPTAEVNVFGSFSTKLYLPTSDVDIVILGTNLRAPASLFELSVALRDHGISRNLEVISKAKVPIIKYTDALTQFPVDISLNMGGGLQAAQIVTQFLSEPNGVGDAIRGLMYLLKQFLLMRHLNEPFNGGCGSYALLILVSTFVKLHPLIQVGATNPLENLGLLFIEFLEYYGRSFNYHDLGIKCDLTSGPGFFYKSEYNFARKPGILTVLDPQDESNDVGGGSWNYYQIKSEFFRCYNRLLCIFGAAEYRIIQRRQSSRNHTRFPNAYDTDQPNSILSAILTVGKGMYAYRNAVEELWDRVLNGLVSTGVEEGAWESVCAQLKKDEQERKFKAGGVKRKRVLEEEERRQVEKEREADGSESAQESEKETIEVVDQQLRNHENAKRDARKESKEEWKSWEREYFDTLKEAKEELGFSTEDDGEVDMEISSGPESNGSEDEERKDDFKSPFRKRARRL
ncbi:hypothetical protein HDU81_005277 [Chytriomyces hyalinus]|nr:hypothetical protein HDU81_005277 [Chytriomyces hyalinus]